MGEYLDCNLKVEGSHLAYAHFYFRYTAGKILVELKSQQKI